MIRINLLPHREEKRRARRQQFYALLGLVTLLAGLIVVLVYSVIAGYLSAQDARNDFLKKEIAVLDKEIDQIKRLKEQSDALMERKRIIESLQRDRAEAVRLLGCERKCWTGSLGFKPLCVEAPPSAFPNRFPTAGYVA